MIFNYAQGYANIAFRYTVSARRTVMEMRSAGNVFGNGAREMPLNENVFNDTGINKMLLSTDVSLW